MSNLKPAHEIKEMLVQRKLTVQDVIDHFGVHKTTIHRYLKGDYSMSATFLYDLAQFTDIDIYEFFEGASGVRLKRLKRP
jgi:transcriptional regulator with XRE-family HTH domain